MMVYEMSDDAEVETFMDLLKTDAQLPGLFLFMGVCVCMYVSSSSSWVLLLSNDTCLRLLAFPLSPSLLPSFHPDTDVS